MAKSIQNPIVFLSAIVLLFSLNFLDLEALKNTFFPPKPPILKNVKVA